MLCTNCQTYVVRFIDCLSTNERRDELNSLCHAIFSKRLKFSISKDNCLNGGHVELDKQNSITVSNNVAYKIAQFLNWKENRYV